MLIQSLENPLSGFKTPWDLGFGGSGARGFRQFASVILVSSRICSGYRRILRLQGLGLRVWEFVPGLGFER